MAKAKSLLVIFVLYAADHSMHSPFSEDTLSSSSKSHELAAGFLEKMLEASRELSPGGAASQRARREHLKILLP